MTFKSQVVSQVTDVVSEIERRAEELPADFNHARKSVAHWGDKATRLVKKSPGLVLLGVFGIGFILAKVARHA